MPRPTIFQRLALAACLALLLAACGGATPAAPTAGALTHIRLPMGFTPSVQYAPFYVAVDKGYFAVEGLALDFDYSFETNGVQLVAAGQLPFAVVSGEQVLLARAQGLPVVYVFAWFQKYPVAVIAKAGAGINAPADLRGKRIGTPLLEGANFVGLSALLAEAGIAPADVSSAGHRLQPGAGPHRRPGGGGGGLRQQRAYPAGRPGREAERDQCRRFRRVGR